MNEILNLKNISQYFYQGKNKINVLTKLDLVLSSSQKVAIIGSSGSGKTSLLNIISLMEKPKTGREQTGRTGQEGGADDGRDSRASHQALLCCQREPRLHGSYKSAVCCLA